jgi:hypothetical protein
MKPRYTLTPKLAIGQSHKNTVKQKMATVSEDEHIIICHFYYHAVKDGSKIVAFRNRLS